MTIAQIPSAHPSGVALRIGQALRYYGAYMKPSMAYVQKIYPDLVTIVVLCDDGARFSGIHPRSVRCISARCGIGYYTDGSLPDAEPAELLRLARIASARQAEEERTRREVMAVEAMRLAAGTEIASSLLRGAAACWAAERRRDVSDAQTDYFASRTIEIVALAASPTARFGFSAARRAAARLIETAHLSKSGREAEHRERFSMGDGLYLGEGRLSGWIVRLYRGPRWDTALLRSLAVRHALLAAKD